MEEANVQVELVETQTSDGFRLDGALHASTGREAAEFDAAILLSGVGSNFYSSKLIEKLALAFESIGTAALRVNTRGHDCVSTCSTNMGGSLQGAAYEIVDHCRLDIHGWVEFMVGRGYNNILLVGHSLGAIKVIYSQAYAPHSYVKKVIAISPPRLSQKRFFSSPAAEQFRQSMLQAEQLMADEKPTMLFQATFPYTFIMSAATYVDKYGSAERYNLLRFANRITCPLHFIYGERELSEPNGAFDKVVSELKSLDWGDREVQFSLISKANHFYASALNELIHEVVG